MEGSTVNSFTRHMILESINREELLIKKYDDYKRLDKDVDFNQLLIDFTVMAREHIEILKNKLGNLDIQ